MKKAGYASLPVLREDEVGCSKGAITGRVCLFLPLLEEDLPGLPDCALSYVELARQLVDAGHEVTVVLDQSRAGGAGFRNWTEQVANTLDPRVTKMVLPTPVVPHRRGPFGQSLTTPYRAYEWLKNQSFDVVHAPDRGGALFYCVAAKELNLKFQETHFCVTATAPVLWTCTANAEPVAGLEWLACTFIERRCVELADTVISPSHYLLRWMLDHGYEVPAQSYVHPWLPREGAIPDAPRSAEVTEIVFVGALEPRKGLPQFVDAIVRLLGNEVRPARVVFAGAVNRKFPVRRFIKEKLEKLGVEWTLRTDLDNETAVEYVASGSRLAVVASQADNAPWAVQELVRRGLPLLVSSAEGLVEQIHPADREAVVFSLYPGELADRMAVVLGQGAVIPRSAVELDRVGSRWLNWHNRQIAAARSALDVKSKEVHPLVSVCLMHFNRPLLVQQAIESVKKQTYPNIEVVLVDDGSTDPSVPGMLDDLEADFASRGWQVARQENLFLGAARNTAARLASGKYLFFLDDDNVLKPSALEVAVSAAEHANVDILTSFSESFSGREQPVEARDSPVTRVVHLGDDIAFGLFRNGFGDSNALIRRKTYMALGGNTEDYGVGKDDEEFFARAVLSGYKLRHLPEPLFWAREGGTRLRDLHYSMHSGQFRVARAYEDALPSPLQNLLLLAQGQQLELEAWDPTGNGSISGLASKRLADSRSALFSTVSAVGQPDSLERIGRKAFQLQVTAFARLIALEAWIIQKTLRGFCKASRLLGK